MNYNVELKTVKPQLIASIRKDVKARNIPRLFPKFLIEIFGYLNKNNIQPVGAPVAIYYNFEKGKGEMEVGMPVSNPITPEGQIGQGKLPGGKTAYLLYVGNMRKIKPAYDAIETWIEKNGYGYTNIWWEAYLTDPNQEPDRNKWQTEIYLQLE